MIYKCPKCGEEGNLHFNYDYSQQHRPIKDILCHNCGEVFEGNISIIELTERLKYKYIKGKGFSAYLEDRPQQDQQDVTAKDKAQALYTKAYNRWCFELSHEKNYITAKDIAINICNEVLGYMGADRGTEWWSNVREILKTSNHKDLYNPENSGLKQ